MEPSALDGVMASLGESQPLPPLADPTATQQRHHCLSRVRICIHTATFKPQLDVSNGNAGSSDAPYRQLVDQCAFGIG